MGLNKTNIGWCEKTWNPIVGCTAISDGCKNCYAKELHNKRHFADWKNMTRPDCYAKTFEKVRFLPERLNDVTPTQKPAKIFVCSMSDLFHEDLNLYDDVNPVITKIGDCSQHIFMILTKRADRMKKYFDWEYYKGIRAIIFNLWLGVTVESDKYLHRIDDLLATPAAKRFVSFEPLLSRIIIPDKKLKKLDWVIIGCESGKNRRKTEFVWVRRLINKCERLKIPVFLKQLVYEGKIHKKPTFNGQKWLQFPK